MTQWNDEPRRGKRDGMMHFGHAPLSRRGLLGGAVGLAAGLALPATVRAAVAPAIRPAHLSAIKAAYERLGNRVKQHDKAVLVDFTLPSARPRLHLVDLEAGTTRTLLVAHGRGSDPAHSGWLKRFSNEPGSAASSRGAYVTDALYTGAHGRSQRLVGLDESNNNAFARAIVIHAAWYAEAAMASTRGMLGRSEGCFAFDEADLPQVLARLGPGRLLLAGKY